MAEVKLQLEVSSTAFSNNGEIPSKYTCEGENINPPISIKEYPEDTRSLVVLMEDPDAPDGPFDHWVMWNIRPAKFIMEDTTPGLLGRNSLRTNKYTGPCPPTGKHKYIITVHALDTMLNLDASATRETLEQAMENHIIATGELVGYYKKKNFRRED